MNATRTYDIKVMDDKGFAVWAGRKTRTFKIEGKAIDAAMKLAREMAGPTTTTGTRVVVREGAIALTRKVLHTFPISKEQR